MPAYHHLLQPLKIKAMNLSNRVVMPPMTTMLANRDNSVSEANLAYIRRMAGNGAGLIISEVAAVHQDGTEGPGMLGIYDDRFINGLGKLVSEIHNQDQKVMAQIYHVGRASLYQLQRRKAVAPSAVAGVFKLIPREMSREDIGEVIHCFGQAAVRARLAGFDGVELHAAHGYLLMQFLSGLSNHRRDEYGGDFKERSRFVLEVIREVRQQAGSDFPVSIRISAEEYAVGGYTIEDMLGIIPLLVEAGIDMIHTSFGTQASPGGMVCPPAEFPAGFNSGLAARIRSLVDVPVIAVGRYTNLADVEETLARGDADLVAIGRQHLADPGFFRNALEGREEATVECLACNQGCLDRLYKRQGIRCAINPITGQELIYPERLPGRSRKVLVVGGGPAGLTAAYQAARLGHQVVLAEKSTYTGGQIVSTARVPFKEVYERWISKLTESVFKAGVDIRFGQAADIDFIKRQAADVVIIATGARTLRPAIPGINHPQVVEAWQVLHEKVELTEPALIIGGGLVGMETADYLRARGIAEVTLVESQSCSPVKKSKGHGYMLHQRLKEAGYHLLLATRVIKIGTDMVIVEKAGREEQLRPIRLVVIAAGSSPCNALEHELKQEKICFHLIGDALQPRGILEAVGEGARAAWSIQ